MLVSRLFKSNYQRYFNLEIFHEISAQLKNLDFQDPRSGRILVVILKDLASAGVLNEDLVSFCMKKANNFKKFQNKAEIPGYNDYLEFLTSLSHCPPEKLKLHYRKETKDEYGIWTAAILALKELDFIIEMDFPNYKGTRMKKVIRDQICHIKFTKNPKKFDLDRNFIYENLIEILGSPEKVYCGQTLPTFPLFQDILICADPKKSTKDEIHAEKLPLEFLKKLEDCKEFVKPPKMKSQWYCIMVPKWDSLSQIGQASGVLNKKIHQLKKLGYEVAIIQPSTAHFWQKRNSVKPHDVWFIINDYVKKLK